MITYHISTITEAPVRAQKRAIMTYYSLVGSTGRTEAAQYEMAQSRVPALEQE